MKVAVIDYEVGNLANVYNAWKRLGVAVDITRDPAVIRQADFIELPGVGAIRDAMANLKKFELIPVLEEQVRAGKFFMGVCLGMQALFEKDYEGGEYDCLGFLPGDIVPFRTALKVPHMGWNELEFRGSHWLQKGLPAHPYVYFVHSYHKSPADSPDVIATADYGQAVPAICGRDNVLGFQFHPEKSGPVGARLLQNVIAYVQEKG
ncbi:imidazole glycerol phosphate synthase subunit HisH [Megasphaera butyrica]|uniref:imidazole glycerol phosphate synthase subunit HisH n=1 Tax=Megasphaera TaxID=906 RepID=UPI000821AB9F|nr:MULTISPECIES: imidazole glycerol phosphate synthase subunit HisH [Megasphaera]SCI14944.1 Imidazole glycerol phosphate synthase subunit HisH 1 [uncultured Ruminococcus sp.]MCU6713556.1 imidazole glycerol phosphate synthase subunit HisH [Megasphaera butyrica]OUO46330.1 imidazole glycerol phosphate synthase subunit HisH [Megasphaera sp. An286]SCH04954.1 Imidazole glycerol phosphate synthase subunit HisH 1 [uncultured Megasphaera sp.]HJE82763.1 imidazole glycerol phosphate synthase subunit HisH